VADAAAASITFTGGIVYYGEETFTTPLVTASTLPRRKMAKFIYPTCTRRPGTVDLVRISQSCLVGLLGKL